MKSKPLTKSAPGHSFRVAERLSYGENLRLHSTEVEATLREAERCDYALTIERKSSHARGMASINPPHNRFLHALRFTWWIVPVSLVLGALAVAYQAQSITSKAPEYLSLAKLVATPQPPTTNIDVLQYREYFSRSYGSTIEVLESNEMRRRAQDRVRALNPDLKEVDIEIRATQNKGSTIFNVLAVGSEPKYTRVFLDALLDEFRAFRETIREQQRNKALTALAEDVVKREKQAKELDAKLAAWRKAHEGTTISAKLMAAEAERLVQRVMTLRNDRDTLAEQLRKPTEAATKATLEASLASKEQELRETEIKAANVSKVSDEEARLTMQFQDASQAYRDMFDLVRKFKVNEVNEGEAVTIMERATGAVQNVQQQWAIRLAVPLIACLAGGILLMLIVAGIIAAATPASQPPPELPSMKPE